MTPGPEQEPAKGEEPKGYVLGQSRAKALGAEVEGRSGVLLSGDTVVSLDGGILGKPEDAEEARAMLQKLMGRRHEVWSALAMGRVEGGRLCSQGLVCGARCAQVRFGEIPEEALEAYLAGEEWKDKAGGYGIQAWAGAFASLVEGRLDTVVGLPMDLFWALWKELGAGEDPDEPLRRSSWPRS